jgi:electron transport complex protein RnfB
VTDIKGTISKIGKSLGLIRDADKTYRALGKHLDKFPIGYPSSISGAEIRLLRQMFTVEDAELAQLLSWKHETFAEILTRLKGKEYTEEKLRSQLDGMESNV